jgi:hypothetical protein
MVSRRKNPAHSRIHSAAHSHMHTQRERRAQEDERSRPHRPRRSTAARQDLTPSLWRVTLSQSLAGTCSVGHACGATSVPFDLWCGHASAQAETRALGARGARSVPDGASSRQWQEVRRPQTESVRVSRCELFTQPLAGRWPSSALERKRCYAQKMHSARALPDQASQRWGLPTRRRC